MTVLQRTDLTTSQKIQCAAAAVAGQRSRPRFVIPTQAKRKLSNRSGIGGVLSAT